MIKIWKEISKRVYVLWYLGLSTLASIGIYFSGSGFNWWEAAIYGTILFLLITVLAYADHLQKEQIEKRNDEFFEDDPDWEKYKELKDKFGNK